MIYRKWCIGVSKSSENSSVMLRKNNLKKLHYPYNTKLQNMSQPNDQTPSTDFFPEPEETKTTEEEKEDETVEDDEEEESSDDDDAWDCVDEEVKDDLECAVYRVWFENRDKVSRERFLFILQIVLNDLELLML